MGRVAAVGGGGFLTSSLEEEWGDEFDCQGSFSSSCLAEDIIPGDVTCKSFFLKGSAVLSFLAQDVHL